MNVLPESLEINMIKNNSIIERVQKNCDAKYIMDHEGLFYVY
jgi:hypothetical protein